MNVQNKLVHEDSLSKETGDQLLQDASSRQTGIARDLTLLKQKQVKLVQSRISERREKRLNSLKQRQMKSMKEVTN